MKRYRTKRVIHINPQDLLVGYTGEIRCDDRLLPLRMTRKYKNALQQEESDRCEQILQLSQLIKKYENLASVINNLRKENKNNINTSLLLELEEQKTTIKKRLLCIKSKLDVLPKTLNNSIKNIFNSNSKFGYISKTFRSLKRKKSEKPFPEPHVNKNCVLSGKTCKKSMSETLTKTAASKTYDVTNRTSLFGSVKSQILVRDKNLQLQTISIDLFSNGENLLNVLSTEFGEDVKSYNVVFGTKQLDGKKSLWEQRIYHGSTVDLRGMPDKKKKKSKENKSIARSTDVVHLDEKSPVSAEATAEEKASISELDSFNISDESVSITPEVNDRTSLFGSVKSQILVRDKNLQLQTISIDLFSNGKNLLNVLSTELGEEVKSYNVVFGTKQLDGKKSLWEQRIYHGSTVDLSVRLNGGMPDKKKKKKKSNENKSTTRSTDNPELWTKAEVGRWIDDTCKDLEIDEKEVLKLKSLNGKGLCSLPKEDWIRRSPDQGDLLYHLWNDLTEKYSNKETETAKEVKLDVVHLDEESPVSAGAAAEEKASISRLDSLNISDESVSITPEVNDSTTPSRGLFGKVDNLKDLEDSISLYDFVNDGKSSNPKHGSVISVTGVCSKEPRCHGFVGTLLIRDDPPGAGSVFSQLKVDIRGSKENKELHSHAVKPLLKKIKPGVPVAVRGRVEKLEDKYVSSALGHEILKFKLVADSDYHALVYVENRASFTRQLSQPWYVEQGIYSFVVDDERLHEGDIIEKTPSRVFCKSTVSDNDIKKFAVAFKNSFDGDIFIAVEESGKVTGVELTEGELLKWREKISKTIGQILPGSYEQVSICYSDQEESESIGKKCFVSVMKLDKFTRKLVEKVRVVARIHVPKGTARVYFSKETDINAFFRVAAETKRFTDYDDLFSRLDSLRSRKIVKIYEEDESYIEQECKKANEQMNKDSQKFEVFKKIKSESQELEFKMILGDNPVAIIEKKHFRHYLCGFLNSVGGSILFGVQEDNQSKVGHVVGIVIPRKEREELVKKTVTILSKFYPPVNTSEFSIAFHDVSVSAELILKYHKTRVARNGKCVLLRGFPDEIGMKWPRFVNKNLPDTLCRVIRVKPQCFCIVMENMDPNSEQFMSMIEQFENENSNLDEKKKIKLDAIDENELKIVLKDLCVLEVKIDPSRHPIHMTKPIETFIFDKQGKLNELSYEKLIYRFGFESTSKFDVKKFLNHVENFDPSGNSYVLIASPFELPKTERDLYGLVIPKWTLAIDFDQHLKQEGHLYHIFENQNDRHHRERNRFVRTPIDRKLDLNPDHGICWLAARGYQEIAKSMSEESHGKWNMTHRAHLKSLLEAELTSCVQPNLLNIVVLWDEGHHALLVSLRMLLEDIFSINGDRTAVTFVCSSPETQSDISNKLVKPLQEDYWQIMEDDRVYLAPPFVMAQSLSRELPDPYQSEDNFQVPKKIICHQTVQIISVTLPQLVQQNINGHLEMMYMGKGRKPDKPMLNKERSQFYTGSKITKLGLQGKIGIKRSKIDDLEKAFKILSNDKKSHVSLIFVRADRGAGTTTMCLQFLFQHHDELPCAQLIEIKDGLVSNIKDINKVTKLPLLLLVDEEIVYLQSFLDFKKEVERENVNVMLLLIEPAEVFCRKQSTQSQRKPSKSRIKSARDSSLYETSPYKVVELRRELDGEEMEKLTNELVTMVATEERNRTKLLLKLKEDAKQQKRLQTFAHFSLTAFGNKFSGLNKYVKFRLEIADQKQQNVLAFLAITHVFTNYLFPVSALASFLEKRKVVLEDEFRNTYLQELLSPPADENDDRRLSFHEVAQEILEQLAVHNQENYWSFVRRVSVQMAKEVLSLNIRTKKIDRLARVLFVTSEYESEQFSLLIRSMKEDNKDTARDTLVDLVEVFEEHTSFRAHLLAHLGKYYMTVYKDFEKAKPLIEKAINDQSDDVLLHHIKGDIIRRYVEVLKEEEDFDMSTIVSHAIESSDCFQIVRNKRPYMSHGYVSDAMVRITVMQAAIKDMGGKKDMSFVDYLIRIIDDIKERKEEISRSERYLLSLIPDAHQYLDEGAIHFEYKAKWKKLFLSYIGDIANLRKLCQKLQEEKSAFSSCYRDWLDDIIEGIRTLYYIFEIETRELSQEELKDRIKEIDESGPSSKFGEFSTKFWIRYSRRLDSVPPLAAVNTRVKQWIAKTKKKRGIPPLAIFYKCVISVLIALKDPSDREKMDEAEKLIKRQLCKKLNKNEVLPLEWLHSKNKHDINSIDSLLHHDDLVKEGSRSSGSGKRKPGREVIEGFLYEKQVTKWQGVVKDIKNEYHGIIVFKDRLEVRFVPQNVQPSMPRTGETVRFCLSFDWSGLSAWYVHRQFEYPQPKSLSEIVSSDEDDGKDNKDTDDENIVPPSFFSLNVTEERQKTWGDYNGKHMQGVVVFINADNGYGFLRHPDLAEKLFFHASQLFNPVKSLEGTISKFMTLEFKVEKLNEEKTRAADIRVLKSADVSPNVQEFLASVCNEQHSSPSSSRRRKDTNITVKTNDTQGQEEGVIARLFSDGTYGFIKPDSTFYNDTIFFHHTDFVRKELSLEVGLHVRFRVFETTKGLRANEILVQSADISPDVQQLLASVRNEQHSSPSSSRRRKDTNITVKTNDTQGQEEGVIARLFSNGTYGFIKPDSTFYNDTIFFHHTDFVRKELSLEVGLHVRFRVFETTKGLQANEILVQGLFNSSQKWENLVNCGIQEGFISATTENGGIINSQKVTGQGNNLPFRNKDILNASNPVVDTKVLFEVQKRGERCIAVKIYVADFPDVMPNRSGLPIATNNFGQVSYAGIPVSINPFAYTGNFDPYGDELEEVDSTSDEK